jgi:GT2 family glycosyltransferase
MSIGVGITAYKRPDVLSLCLKQIEENTSGYKLFVYDDTITKKGVAHSKNECLKALKDCDHIFLFDDDCFPIQKGWAEWVINKAEETNQKHLLYLKDVGSIRCVIEEGDLQIFNNCGGAFMYLHKDCIEKVGGFCKDYGRYGYEHAGYSIRVHKAGLTTKPFVSIKNMGGYIYSLDYDFTLKYDIDFESSIADEVKEIPYFLQENEVVFKKEINTIFQAL